MAIKPLRPKGGNSVEVYEKKNIFGNLSSILVDIMVNRNSLVN